MPDNTYIHGGYAYHYRMKPQDGSYLFIWELYPALGQGPGAVENLNRAGQQFKDDATRRLRDFSLDKYVQEADRIG